ncbi:MULTISPECIES: hypothetical protein [unclassified Helicobacter]|uniref:hypothetical protein n=1 Tax=unclassified Helicobacter TaxID=2593540 RepID=UPI001315334E|nr:MULTISPECIES: hypothetical protein [unclassified Helicobacter]
MKKRFFVFSAVLSSFLMGQEVAEEKKELSPEETAKKDISQDQSFIKKVVTGIKFNGVAFIRQFNNFGDLGGSSQQYRLKLDVTSGEVYGYSVTGGIFFSQGTSTPGNDNVTYGSIQGSRGSAYNAYFSDRFGIGVLYASKSIKTENIDFKANLGKMNINSPLSDKTLDLATGLEATLKHKNIQYHFHYANSWITDTIAYVFREQNLKNSSGTSIGKNQSAAAIGLGNHLFILGASGKKVFKNFDFNIYGVNALNLFDLLFFADGAYTFKTGAGDFTIKAQVATANLNSTPNILLGGDGGKKLTSNLHTSIKDEAQFRGIYNINIAYKYSGFSTKIGYLGSFGDGYGVSLTSKGGIDVGGKMWYSNFSSAYSGFGVFSSGSKKGTDIKVAYLATEYKFKKPVRIGFDAAYITGKNNFYLTTGSTPQDKTFWELTPSIKYNFTKNLEISALSAFYVGGMEIIKTRLELKYNF